MQMLLSYNFFSIKVFYGTYLNHVGRFTVVFFVDNKMLSIAALHNVSLLYLTVLYLTLLDVCVCVYCRFEMIDICS